MGLRRYGKELQVFSNYRKINLPGKHSIGDLLMSSPISVYNLVLFKKTMQEERRAISENASHQLKAAMAKEETSLSSIEKEEKHFVNLLKVLEKRPPRSEFYFFKLMPVNACIM